MFWLGVSRLALILVNLFALGRGFDSKAFDDNILFKINWPGSSVDDLLDPQANAELYTITSPNKEQYQCSIPNLAEKEIKKEQEYTGKNPVEYIFPLFGECSYRLESYWTYEVCHGREVKQYHEERDGKKDKQKYRLGILDPNQIKDLVAKYDEMSKNPNRKLEIPYKKIDGVNMPYMEIEMSGGTMCDINDKPRSIRVLYVCHHREKHEIYSIKEVASCEYEAIVKTRFLCDHPDYRLQDTEENKIICKPLGNAPKKPRSLMTMEAERLKMRYEKVSNSKQKEVYVIFHVDKDGQDGHSQLRLEIRPIGTRPLDNSLSYVNHGSDVLEDRHFDNFLSGSNCLHGGSGWWKFEFCYGRWINQYHVEADGKKTIISLGKYDEQKHKDWIDANPEKKPKAQRKFVSHFYSEGSMCDEIKKPRQTEVKLKCVKNPIGSPHSVSMYLEEHKTCEYELVVESRLLCEFLEYADDTYGIINNEKSFINTEKSTTNLRVKDDEEKIARDGDEL